MTEKGDARVGDDGREWRRWPKGGTMAEREGGGDGREGDDGREWVR